MRIQINIYDILQEHSEDGNGWYAECDVDVGGRERFTDSWSKYLRATADTPKEAVLKVIEKLDKQGWELK